MFPKPTKAPNKGKLRREAYKQARAEYLQEHPWCEVGEVCQQRLPTGGWLRARASEVHHQRGRDGDALLDTDFWLATCRPCHRWIHANPNLSVGRGYTIRRASDRELLAEHYSVPNTPPEE